MNVLNAIRNQSFSTFLKRHGTSHLKWHLPVILIFSTHRRIFNLGITMNNSKQFTILSKILNTSAPLNMTFDVLPNFEKASWTIPFCVTGPVFFVIFLLSFLGNTSVILVMYRTPRMRTRINVLLTNLSVANLLLTTLCLPFFATESFYETDWIFQHAWCKLHSFCNI